MRYLFALVLLTSPAAAAWYDGNELLQVCGNNDRFVYFYVAAVADKAVADQAIANYFVTLK